MSAHVRHRRPAVSRAIVSAIVLAAVAAACAAPAARSGAGRSGRWIDVAPGPPARVGQSAVWDGNRLLVWGGQDVRGGAYHADGAAFDPDTGRWSGIPGAPLEPRSEQTAVWTGSRLIVWGGDVQGPRTGTHDYADGAAFDPATNRWSFLPASPLAPRALHVAVWTGTRMLVWGGVETTGREGLGAPADWSGLVSRLQGGSAADGEEESEGGRLLNDGAAYDPSTDRWTPLAPAPIEGRALPIAVWTGRELLVWGGGSTDEDGVAFSNGAAYDPATNRWRSIGNAPVTAGGRYAGAWTGRQLVVWGGPRGEGAAYDPISNRWSRLPRAPLPVMPIPAAVWTGRSIVVWGLPEAQAHANRPVAAGAAFDPGRGRWSALPGRGGPAGEGQSAVWTGEGMVLWGGFVGEGRSAPPGFLALGPSAT